MRTLQGFANGATDALTVFNETCEEDAFKSIKTLLLNYKQNREAKWIEFSAAVFKLGDFSPPPHTDDYTADIMDVLFSA